jgi:hypothetical protein
MPLCLRFLGLAFLIAACHTKCTKKCCLRTNCNAVLKELGPKTLNRIVARSSHSTYGETAHAHTLQTGLALGFETSLTKLLDGDHQLSTAAGASKRGRTRHHSPRTTTRARGLVPVSYDGRRSRIHGCLLRTCALALPVTAPRA